MCWVDVCGGGGILVENIDKGKLLISMLMIRDNE